MDILKTAENLIRFKTETGNMEEADKCLNYIHNLFKGTSAKVEIFKKDNLAPVIFISNYAGDTFDAMILGHVDVVPAPSSMFEPKTENGKMYGRGTLDMKTFAAVALNSMQHVLDKKLPLKFGVLLSTDEEKGSKGLHAFLEEHPKLTSTIVLDNDVGGDIFRIVNKCKNPVFVKISAKGLEAHGSTPWEGNDANEKMLQTLTNIRKVYPYFSKDTGGAPENKWVNTVHFAKIEGGDVANVISNYCEALLDFRLTETSTVEELKNNLDKCVTEGVNYEIVSSSTPVVMSENDPYIVEYKKFAEEILGQELRFEQIGGATDSQSFAIRGSTIIMHSGTGDGMHTNNEWVEIDTILKISKIQIKFLEKLAG